MLQAWYADDANAGGSIPNVIKWFSVLIEKGPVFGYFPEPQKSIVVVQPTEAERVGRMLQETFASNCPKVVTGQRLLGGHLGDAAGKRQYVRDKVEHWVSLIQKLADIAVHDPQAAYIALVCSVQCEWNTYSAQ